MQPVGRDHVITGKLHDFIQRLSVAYTRIDGSMYATRNLLCAICRIVFLSPAKINKTNGVVFV